MNWYVIHYSAAGPKPGNVEAPTAQQAAEEVASWPSTGESGYITVHSAPGSSIIYRLDLGKPMTSRPDFRQIGRDGGRRGRSNPARSPRPPRSPRLPRKSSLYAIRPNPDLLGLYRAADPNWFTRPDWVEAFKRGEPPPRSAGQTQIASVPRPVKSDLSVVPKKSVEVAQSSLKPSTGIESGNGFTNCELVNEFFENQSGYFGPFYNTIQGEAYIYSLFSPKERPWTIILVCEYRGGESGPGMELTGVLLDPEGKIIGTGRYSRHGNIHPYDQGVTVFTSALADVFLTGGRHGPSNEEETVLQLAEFLKETGKPVMGSGVVRALRAPHGWLFREPQEDPKDPSKKLRWVTTVQDALAGRPPRKVWE